MAKELNYDDVFDFCGEIYNEPKKKKKKKKNKKGKKSVKNDMDNYFKHMLNEQWNDAMSDIENMSNKMKKADSSSAIYKKQTGKIEFIHPDSKSTTIRKEIADSLKDGKFIKSISSILSNGGSMVVLFAKVFCLFIVSLLSIDSIKKYISPTILSMINSVYTVALNLI